MYPLKVFKKRIFGIDLNIEFDFWGPVFKTWQAIYELRLKNLWNCSSSSSDFIRFALRHLPNGSFIIFEFNETGDKFIQFMKGGTSIILDFPIWETNIYFNKRKVLMEILKKSGIKKSAIYNLKLGKSGSALRINFRNHNAIACRTALEICKTIFENEKPKLLGYKTSILVPTFNLQGGTL